MLSRHTILRFGIIGNLVKREIVAFSCHVSLRAIDPLDALNRIYGALLFVLVWMFHYVSICVVYLPEAKRQHQILYSFAFFKEDYCTLSLYGFFVTALFSAFPNRSTRWVLLAGFPVIGIIRYIQYLSLLYTHNFLREDAFAHIQLLANFVTIAHLIQLGLVVLITVGLIVFLRRRMNHIEAHRNVRFCHRIVRLLVIWSIPPLVAVCCHFNTSQNMRMKAAYNGIIRSSPEIVFWMTLQQYFFQKEDSSARDLNSIDRKQVEAYGLVYDDQHFPLWKPSIFKTPIPIKSNTQAPPLNVIVLFLESLSASLLSTYTSDDPNISTPAFDDFASHSTVVYNYYNHATPTITSLRGQLCSFYPTDRWC